MSEFMTVAGARSMVAGLEAAMSLAPRVDTAAQLAAVYSTLSRDREALKLIEFVWGRWQNIENGMNYAMMLQDVCEWGRAARIAELELAHPNGPRTHFLLSRVAASSARSPSTTILSATISACCCLADRSCSATRSP